MNHPVLTIAIDILLPGDGDFPAASQLDLATRLMAHPHFGPATQAFAHSLPKDLQSGTDGVERMADLERDHATIFNAMLTGVYSLYYSDPLVLAVVARTTGYTPRAPQPDGYELAPFDPSILSVVASRPPHFRKVGESDNGN